jgi:hypothetical protein
MKLAGRFVFVVPFALAFGLSQTAHAERYYVQLVGEATPREVVGDPDAIKPLYWTVQIFNSDGKRWGASSEDSYGKCAAWMQEQERRKSPDAYPGPLIPGSAEKFAEQHRRDYARLVGPIAVVPRSFGAPVGPILRTAALGIVDDWKGLVEAELAKWHALERNAKGFAPETPLVGYVRGLVDAADRVRNLKDLLQNDRTMDTLSDEAERMFRDTASVVGAATSPMPWSIGGSPPVRWRDVPCANLKGLQFSVEPVRCLTGVGMAVGFKNDSQHEINVKVVPVGRNYAWWEATTGQAGKHNLDPGMVSEVRVENPDGSGKLDDFYVVRIFRWENDNGPGTTRKVFEMCVWPGSGKVEVTQND